MVKGKELNIRVEHSTKRGNLTEDNLTCHHLRNPLDSHLRLMGSFSFLPHNKPPVLNLSRGQLDLCSMRLMKVFMQQRVIRDLLKLQAVPEDGSKG